MNIRNDKLAKSLQEKKVNDFWREVRSRRDGATIVSKEIDNQKNPLRIADLFASKLSAVTGKTKLEWENKTRKNTFTAFPVMKK